MNTHRTTTLTATLTAALLLVATAASAERYSIREKIREVPDRLEVEIWTDRGDGARYRAGESIEVYFRTNVDAWVAIYDIDTRGRVHRLFPSRHHRDNFVYGGEVHRLRSRYGHHFEVEGPSGWETLRAVASTDRYALDEVGDGHRGRYRPARSPACDRVAGDRVAGDRITHVPNKVREVPDHRRHEPWVAVAEARHYVRERDRARGRRRVPRPGRRGRCGDRR